MRNFAATVSDRRRASGLTQAQLAERSGVSLRQVAAYERGESLPRFDAAVAIAHALGVSVDELAGAGEAVA